MDLVVDSVAGPLFSDLVNMLGFGGRISVVGRSGGTVPDFNTATLFFRRNRIGGVAVSHYAPEEARQAWNGIVTGCALMVMPRSRSKSIESSI